MNRLLEVTLTFRSPTTAPSLWFGNPPLILNIPVFKIVWIFCKLSVLSFELVIMLSLHWSWKISFPDSTYFGLKVLIAECVTLNCHEKKMCWMLQQGTEKSFSELSFELALALWLQWFSKIPFTDSTYFELKVLIAECATLESYEKKICWMLQQGTEKSIFIVLSNWLWHYDCNDSAKYHFQIKLILN